MQFERIVNAEQRGHMLALLVEGFPNAAIDWPSALAAPSGGAGHGLLLIADGEPQGGMLSFEKMETIGGRRRRVVNFSSWYIRPRYRQFAIRMMREASDDPDTIYMVGSPIRSVQKICLRNGFRYLSHGSIASAPLINGAIARNVTGIAPFAPGALSDPDHDRWMTDHSDERHIGLLVRIGAQMLPVLWLRGQKLRGLRAARLLFTTDYAALRKALPAIHWYMLRRHGIAGLYVPRIGPLASLRSARRRYGGPSLMVKGQVDAEDVNLLYSEFLYLRGLSLPA